jgi:hypothetical protein
VIDELTETDGTSEDCAARLALIFQESVRGLTHQQGVVESINTRAGNLIFATAFATSLLGGRALADGISGWDWVALSLLLAIGVLVVFVLWPHHSYVFRFDPLELLRIYGADSGRETIHSMHRGLSMRIHEDLNSNWRMIVRLRAALQLALVLFVLNILAWLFAVGRV